MGIITCYYFQVDTSKYPGALTLESGTGCATVMTLFSGQSALAKFTINVSLMCPPPFKFLENVAFSALFWPEFQLSRRKFSKCSFPRPLIFLKENLLPIAFRNLCGPIN